MSDFARFDGMRRLLIDDLRRATANRDTRSPDWEETELRAFWQAACERAVMGDLQQPTWEDVLRSDMLAVGHFDWSTKLPLYVCEVMFGKRVYQ